MLGGLWPLALPHWRAVVLGAVQGLTEFLPVSSSGHLVLTQAVLRIPRPGLVLETGLHLGTLLAVVAAYPRDVAGLFRGVWDLVTRRGGSEAERLLLLLWATLPAAIAGPVLEHWIERLFDTLPLVALGWVLTGVVLLGGARARPGRRRLEDLGLARGWRVGLAQVLALAPGVSRSGMTLVAGLWQGLEPGEAARFAFLLSLPTVGGAVALHLGALTHGVQARGIWVGSAVACGTGLLAIRALLARLKSGALLWCGVYCLALAALSFGRGLALGPL